MRGSSKVVLINGTMSVFCSNASRPGPPDQAESGKAGSVQLVPVRSPWKYFQIELVSETSGSGGAATRSWLAATSASVSRSEGESFFMATMGFDSTGRGGRKVYSARRRTVMSLKVAEALQMRRGIGRSQTKGQALQSCCRGTSCKYVEQF